MSLQYTSKEHNPNCDANIHQYFHGDKETPTAGIFTVRQAAEYRTGCSYTQNVVANPGASPAAYFMGNGTRQGMKKTTLFYLVLRLRMSGATYPLGHTPS